MSTLSEKYFTMLDRLLKSGEHRAVVEHAKEFYRRMPTSLVFKAQSIGLQSVTFSVFDSLDQFYITVAFEGSSRLRMNGQLVSDARLAERLGVSLAYIDGCRAAVLALCKQGIAAEERDNELQRRHGMVKSMIKECKRLRADLRRRKSQLDARDRACANALRRSAAARQRSSKAKQAEVAARRHFSNTYQALLATVNEQCDHWAMPQVPSPSITADVISQQETRVSGIYFGWNGSVGCPGQVVYVGKSIDIPARMRSHKKVERGMPVSFIAMHPREIHFAELFYIWLLRPTKNREFMETSDVPACESEGFRG